MADRLQTEFTSFGYAPETAGYGITAATGWRGIEPDQVSEFDNTYLRERRDPFDVDRLMNENILTGYTAMASWEGDATQTHLHWLLPRVLMADWQWRPGSATGPNAGEGMTVSGISASNADVTLTDDQDDLSLMTDNVLVEITKPANSAGPPAGRYRCLWTANTRKLGNLRPIGFDDSTDNKYVTVGNALATAQFATGSANIDMRVRVIGYCLTSNGSGNDLVFADGHVEQEGGTGTEHRGDLTDRIHAGSGVFIAGHRGSGTANAEFDKLLGFARAVGGADGRLNFERSEGGLPASVTANTTVDDSGAVAQHAAYIFVSEYIHNVPADNDRWSQQSDTLCAQYSYTDTSSGAPVQANTYEVMSGCNLNSLSLRFPQQSRIRVTADFVGSVKRTEDAPPAGWANLVTPSTQALATSVDVGRARLFNADDGSDIATLLQQVDLQFSNSIEGDYVLDRIESQGPQIGKFGLSASVTCLVTGGDLLRVVEGEEIGNMQLTCGGRDGHWMIDVPRMTMSEGRKNYDRNRTLKIDYTVDYLPSAIAGHRTALVVSYFPWLPLRANSIQN